MGNIFVIVGFSLILSSVCGKSIGRIEVNTIVNVTKPLLLPNPIIMNKSNPANESDLNDRSFELCEQFNVTSETQLLRLHGDGVTVLTKLTL